MPTPVPLIDMERQYLALEPELVAAIVKVCASGRFILGPDCQGFEQDLATYCQANHAIGCASGSDALLLALMALDIGAGHEVVVPSYTFFATASAVARLGAKPVFVDIDPSTYNLDPACVARAVTKATRAIIPVHLFGQCADMAAIDQVAKAHNLPVIEDACQAIGAEYRGRRAGALADMACFSFYPTKNLGGFGDGGMLTTRRADLADRLRLLRVHGMQPRYYHQLLGINSRLDTIQAAVLRVKFEHLERWTERRRQIAARYGELCAEFGLDEVLTLPCELADRRHVWNQYVVRVPEGRRDALRQHLSERKIGTEIYYPVPLHEQKCFEYLECRLGSLPKTEAAARETIALPIFPELMPHEQETVVREIGAFFGLVRKAAGSAMLAGPKFLKETRHADATTKPSRGQR
ncbi:MAG TPA: DegT/DnrJ/EryC1/StrS family aminotransferase [Pirellulales bacterium]|nr:DegT/DnrJ/EryC1/StrS family aminotransferase [Pirellulales bacterium]